MKSYALYLVFLTIVVIGANAVASSASSGSGDGYISCDLETVAGSTACQLGSSPEQQSFEISISSGQTVAVTITWAASGPTSEELSLFVGDSTGQCECEWRTHGHSPVSLEVPWPAEAGSRAIAIVGTPTPCPGPFGTAAEEVVAYGMSCTFPPARIVKDQPFHYEWTVT